MYIAASVVLVVMIILITGNWVSFHTHHSADYKIALDTAHPIILHLIFVCHPYKEKSKVRIWDTSFMCFLRTPPHVWNVLITSELCLKELAHGKFRPKVVRASKQVAFIHILHKPASLSGKQQHEGWRRVLSGGGIRIKFWAILWQWAMISKQPQFRSAPL